MGYSYLDYARKNNQTHKYVYCKSSMCAPYMGIFCAYVQIIPVSVYLCNLDSMLW